MSGGKDFVLFVTKEEQDKLNIQEDADPEPVHADSSFTTSTTSTTSGDGGGLMGEDMGEAVGEDGEINWDCPCLQGMTTGPCADTFKSAFSCFVYSKEDPKGSDCLDEFSAFQECIVSHPEEYGPPDDIDVDGDGDATPTTTDADAPAPSGTAEDAAAQ